MIYLIAGYKRSGKTTFADALHSSFTAAGCCVLRVAFADELRKHLSILNPLVGNNMRWNQAITTYGYDAAKVEFPEIRRLLQTYGTEVIRDRVGAEYWAEFGLAAAQAFLVRQNLQGKQGVVLIDDCRFLNEWQLCSTDERAVLLRITRPGIESDGHASEDLRWIDELPEGLRRMEITNDTDLHALREAANICVEEACAKLQATVPVGTTTEDCDG